MNKIVEVALPDMDEEMGLIVPPEPGAAFNEVEDTI